MRKPQKKKRYLLSAFVIVLALVSSVVQAATYPPSIKPPKVGQPVLSSVAPLDSAYSAVVPIATSTEIPTVTGKIVSLQQAGPLIGVNRNLNSAAINSTAVRLNTGLILGGVPTYKVTRTPLATVKAGQKSEIQTALNLPTRVSITGLKRGNAIVSAVVSYSTTIDLFKVAVNSKGVITLPPISLQDKQLPVSLQVTLGTQKYVFPFRAIN